MRQIPANVLTIGGISHRTDEDSAVALDRIWYFEVDVSGVGTATALLSRSRDGSFTATVPRGVARLVGRKQEGDDLEVPHLVIPSAETFDLGVVRPEPLR